MNLDGGPPVENVIKSIGPVGACRPSSRIESLRRTHCWHSAVVNYTVSYRSLGGISLETSILALLACYLSSAVRSLFALLSSFVLCVVVPALIPPAVFRCRYCGVCCISHRVTATTPTEHL